MKAFIAVTLLAACVAAQTFDHQIGLRQLLKRENGLFKDIYGIGKDFTYDTLRNVNTYPYTIPTSYNYNTINDVDTLTLEELIQHPLFQTYYTLPLFHQHFTHPLFRLYLTTPYFQKYWTQPIFTKFFRNPYLFNKYIYPTVYNTVATGVYDRDFTNINTQTQTTPSDTIFGKKYTDVVYPFNTGYPINNNHVQYAQIMDKILKTILVNKPELIDVNFNIHTPIEKKTFEKTVDPITGEIKYTINVDDIKTIGKKMTPVDKIVERELIKNLIFLNKVIYGDRKIGQRIPEIFNINKYETTTIPLDLLTKYENIPRDLLAKYTIPFELTKKFEKKTTPLGYVNRFATIPRGQLLKTKYDTIITKDEKINNIETIIPQEIDITKKIETETDKKIENIIKPIETIETEKTIRVRRDTSEDTTIVNAEKTETVSTGVENTREGKTYYYVPLTHTYRHQVYTVPTTQYVVGEQHQAQVPVTKDASTVYTPVTQQVVHNTAPLGYHYGSTHYTVPTTYAYYPTQTYITA